VLTCKACNNDAGAYFDGQAHRQERLRQLVSSQSDRPETVTFTVDDFPTRVEMRTAGRTGMLFTVIPQINNPAAVELTIEHMRVLSETRTTDFRFTVTPQVTYHPDRARLAWIRAAYLAAFALFGWTYILQPALQPIRDQLRNPSTPGLPPLACTTRTATLTAAKSGSSSGPPSTRACSSSQAGTAFSCPSRTTREASTN